MRAGLTCAACGRPFAGRVARAYEDGYRHVVCQRNPPRAETLPFEPLEPYWHRIAELPYKHRIRQTVEKARERGRITIRTADNAAILLGLHPALIWGDDWWLPVLEESA